MNPRSAQQSVEAFSLASSGLPTVHSESRPPDIGGHNGVRGARHEYGAWRLWIPGNPCATAGIPKGRDVARLIGDLEVAAIDRPHTQSAIEGVRARGAMG
jgi:hypothetical protein